MILAADTNVSDADRLKLGQEQYKNGQYDDAVTSLQMVKKDSLSEAEKKTLDDSAVADSPLVFPQAAINKLSNNFYVYKDYDEFQLWNDTFNPIIES